VRVIPLRRKTRFQPLVRRYWTGFDPQGSYERFPRCNRYIPSSFPKLCLAQAGWPWRLPARAPTDPDVLALEHPVPRPTGLPSAMVPEAIRSSYGDMRRNLNVLHLFPSIGSAGRRFASLPRVLRGEFPCFNGTIKALRLPVARPAALRCLRLAVPPAFTRSFRSPADECAAEAWSW
jgi:hypothetical protein